MELLLQTIQQLKGTRYCYSALSNFNVSYDETDGSFLIKIPCSDRGTPCIKYDGVKLTYYIDECRGYSDPECADIEDLFDTMYFIEED